MWLHTRKYFFWLSALVLTISFGVAEANADVKVPTFIHSIQNQDDWPDITAYADFVTEIVDKIRINSAGIDANNLRESKENIYVKSLDDLGLSDQRKQIEQFAAVSLAKSGILDFQLISLVLLSKAGDLSEDSIRIMNAVINHPRIPKPVRMLAMRERLMLEANEGLRIDTATSYLAFNELYAELQESENPAAIRPSECLLMYQVGAVVVNHSRPDGIAKEVFDKLIDQYKKYDISTSNSGLLPQSIVMANLSVTVMNRLESAPDDYISAVLDKLEQSNEATEAEKRSVVLGLYRVAFRIKLADRTVQRMIDFSTNKEINAASRAMVAPIVGRAGHKLPDEIVREGFLAANIDTFEWQGWLDYMETAKSRQHLGIVIDQLRKMDVEKMSNPSDDGTTFIGPARFLMDRIQFIAGAKFKYEKASATKIEILNWWGQQQ